VGLKPHANPKSAASIIAAMALLCSWGASGTALAQVDVSAWPKVRMNVMAMDGQDAPITGLTAGALAVLENKAPANHVDLAPDAEAQSLCLLIDASGSMYDRLDAVRAATKRLLRTLPAEDEICVADFSVPAYVDQGLTTDRARDAQGLEFIRASGGTALRDAVIAMSAYLRKNGKYKSHAIILVSDGEDNASTAGEDALRKELESAGAAVVHVLCVPSPQAHGCGSEKAALRLTKMSGGLTYFPRDAAETEAAVDHLNAALRARYILSYEPQDSAPGGMRRLDVAFEKTHAVKKAILLAPEGYYAPSW
jgi:VWFA-related protein